MSERFNIALGDDEIDVELRWNNRRKTRMGLMFDSEGRLLVDAPAGTGLDEVRALVGAHAKWIKYRSQRATSEQGTWFPRNYEPGVLVFYRGTPYALAFDDSEPAGLDGEYLRVQGPNPAAAKAQVWDWYREQAPRVLGAVVESVATSLPWVEETPVWRHRYMRSQWGSCTGSSRISLNTHLVKLEDDLIRYVVLHEMCHIMYLNHGPRFYRLMETYLPDWKEYRRQLNRFVGLLAEPTPA